MNSSLSAVDDFLDTDRVWPSLLSLLQPEQSLNPKDEDHLFKRVDVCYQAFGQGWSTSTCAPSNTLCCLNQNSNYPQCEKYLNAGWCCTAYQSTCYIDLSSTSCDAVGSVPCTELAAGVSEACCIPNTVCAPGYNASSTYARCNIQQGDLQALANPSTSTRTTTRTSTQTSSLTSTDSAATSSKSTAYSIGPVSTAATSSNSSPSPTTINNNQNGTTNLSGGAIAGIAIAPVVAVLIILGLAFWFWRRRSRKQKLEAAGPVAAQYQDMQPQHQAGYDGANTYYAPAYYANGVQTQEKAAEMATQNDPKEMSADNGIQRHPAELEATMHK